LKWIGLTGGIASGKTTVANGLRSRGYAVVDADDLARRAVEPGSQGLKQVVQAFGRDVLRADGSLDRPKLGQLIFSHPDLRQKLEAIIHPEVRRLSALERTRLEREGKAIAFYDVPLLFEKKMEAMFDAVIVVSTSEALQKKWLASRNKLTAAEVEARMSAQLPLRDKAGKAHYVIKNEGTLKELDSEIERVLAELSRGG
jgi:dephospho-CoA kinase